MSERALSNPSFTRALLIGHNQGLIRGAEADVARWVSIVRGAHPGPALAADQVVCLVGADVRRASVLEAVARFAAAVAEDQRATPQAAGLLMYAGPGWGDQGGVKGGFVTVDDQVSYADLVDVLDQAFTTLAEARVEGERRHTLTSVRLPRPPLLAVLDTAAVQLPGAAGWTSRCVDGPPAGGLGPADAPPPRLCYHARQIAAQLRCGSGEREVGGVWEGEITATFGPWFARNHRDLALFAQEIGPGNDGVVVYEGRYGGGLSLGTVVVSGTAPQGPLATAVRPRRGVWYTRELPDAFTLQPVAAPPATWRARAPLIDADNMAFPTATQGAQPAWTQVYTVRAEDGLDLGYMGIAGPSASPTGQWWAAPFGAVDNHGYLVTEGTLRFERLAQPPVVPPTWRLVQTLPATV